MRTFWFQSVYEVVRVCSLAVLCLISAACGGGSTPLKSPPDGPSLRITRQKVVNFTPKALRKIKEFQAIDKGEFLRVDVLPGFVYDIRFEDSISEDEDILDEQDGVKVVVSKLAHPYLIGSRIDWKVDPGGNEGFHFDNPNALESSGPTKTN